MTLFTRTTALKVYDRLSGRHISTRLKELDQTQWLNAEEGAQYQQQKLFQILSYAQEYVPYYRQLFAERGFDPQEIRQGPVDLSLLPFLTKNLTRENFTALQTTDPRRRSNLFTRFTSGSSGQPLTFMTDSNFRDYFTADIHRHLSWGGWHLGQRHAYIGGRRDKSFDWRAIFMNLVFNRINLDAYILSPESLNSSIKRIRRFRPQLIYGYTSSVYYLARFVLEQGITDLGVNAVFVSAETLFPYQRQTIEEAFQCPLYNRYASLELGEIASQCPQLDGLHISTENVFVEIIDDQGRPAPAGQPGYMVVTNLTNYGMPLIRYQLDDKVTWHPDPACPCGRAQPRLANLIGRERDYFIKRDGTLVWTILAIPLSKMPEIRQYQIIQKDFEWVIVRIVCEGDFPVEHRAAIEESLRQGLGQGIIIDFDFPDEIAVGPSGKVRHQYSEINKPSDISFS